MPLVVDEALPELPVEPVLAVDVDVLDVLVEPPDVLDVLEPEESLLLVELVAR